MRWQHYHEYFSNRYELHTVSILSNLRAILEGRLSPRCGGPPTPITCGIPRFVRDDAYATAFALQWNTFRRTQLDSVSGLPLTASRFWQNTKWHPDELVGKRVLEAGCGAGRFTEVLLSAGARVISFDLSAAIEANGDLDRWAVWAADGSAVDYLIDVSSTRCSMPASLHASATVGRR